MLKNPSTTEDIYWIFAQREVPVWKTQTNQSGKWLIFCPIDTIDEMWTIIREATIKGKLGNVSKVSTKRPNPNSQNKNTKVICVYTYDSNDIDDVMEIRKQLSDLGFTQQLIYKTDQTTREGKYSRNGNRVGTYYR